MSEFELSPEARRSLWQCYALLLALADEVEKETGSDDELSAVTKADEMSRPDDETSPPDPEQRDVTENQPK